MSVYLCQSGAAKHLIDFTVNVERMVNKGKLTVKYQYSFLRKRCCLGLRSDLNTSVIVMEVIIKNAFVNITVVSFRVLLFLQHY